MGLDEFRPENDSSRTTSSSSGSRGGGTGKGKHGVGKLDFSSPYMEIVRTPQDKLEVRLGVSRTIREGDPKEPDEEQLASIQSRLTWKTFREACKDQHGVDPLDVAREDYSFRGFIESLDELSDDDSSERLLLWLVNNTDLDRRPESKDVCDVCGAGGYTSDGSLKELYMTDKDIVSRDQTRIVVCGEHTTEQIIAAVNSKRQSEDKGPLY